LTFRDRQDKVAYVDLIFRLDYLRARDFSAVDVRAVRALQVDDDEFLVFDDDSTVTLRNVALGQDDVVALDSADADFSLVEVVGRLLAVLLTDRDCEQHGLLPPGSFAHPRCPRKAPLRLVLRRFFRGLTRRRCEPPPGVVPADVDPAVTDAPAFLLR
jgi:hypothetical protein